MCGIDCKIGSTKQGCSGEVSQQTILIVADGCVEWKEGTNFLISCLESTSNKCRERAHETDLYDLIPIKSLILQIISIKITVIGHFHTIADIAPEVSDGGHDIANVVLSDMTVLIQVTIFDFDGPRCVTGVSDQQMQVSVDLVFREHDG